MASYAVISLAVALCIAVAQAGYVHGGHGAIGGYEGHEEYAHSKPHYQFKYGVHDSHTGDIKDQWEERDGDVVKGSYSLVEPDGTIRQVDYTSDGHNGFNAVVKKSGKASHPSGHQHGQGHASYPF